VFIYLINIKESTMFGNKKNDKAVATKTKPEKLPGPRPIAEPVQKQMTGTYKLDPELVQIFKMVMHRKNEGEKEFDIRIFDESACLAKKVQVKDYTTLDAYPDLILYEGTFDEADKRVDLKEKNRPITDTPIYSEAEILQKIEALDKPGSTVMFFLGRGPANGGPLGKGCTIVELISSDPKKKEYNIYTADVIGTQPVDKGDKLFHSNKEKQIVKWIKEAHHKRIY
jgi:hypothetical protein